MHTVTEALRAYFDCRTWPEAEQVVRARPELLTPAAATTLTMLAAGQPPRVVRGVFGPHSDLLARCRDVGVDRAFAEKLAPLRAVPPRLLERLRAAQESADRADLLALLRD